MSSAGLNPARPGSGMPVPPPIEENFSMMSITVAASTQVAMAK